MAAHAPRVMSPSPPHSHIYSQHDQTDNSIKRVFPDGHATTILLCTVQAS